ncbi:hypothetical protein SAMN05443287_105235 [Micromonospora phaseoli]|uniref:Uncharacterized protein n=1 Tax=Micromonospora phaseoli TaxID=1144548 RepID=A0A1H6ZVN1_9ACTN|nr:hypothetical protein [Micromonospora phaseoli]PZV97069.1 hypothetical protein CLV64_106177 [Micromonospora phaseoli]GIJ77352.1 hypothetical protein Xph01_17840 [Micromonospora phaseoli]SEJ55657.1 hypothetical protein SAMN05443287_105235 [Micromonospora phaseoli]
MPDEDLRVMELLQRDLQGVRWLEAAEIRAVARRRSRMGMALVFLAVLSTSVVAVAAMPAREGVAPAGRSTVSPTPREEIAPEALLHPEDMPTNVGAPTTDTGVGEPIELDPAWTRCLEEKRIKPLWETSRYVRSQSLTQDPPAWVADGTDARWSKSISLHQKVYRISPELERTFFAGIERRITPCLAWESVEVGQIEMKEWADFWAVQRWEVTAEGFAGDESVLIRHTTGETRRDDANGEVVARPMEPETIAVVRVGDLVTVFRLSNWGGDVELRHLATVAAKRMCLAANPPC